MAGCPSFQPACLSVSTIHAYTSIYPSCLSHQPTHPKIQQKNRHRQPQTFIESVPIGFCIHKYGGSFTEGERGRERERERGYKPKPSHPSMHPRKTGCVCRTNQPRRQATNQSIIHRVCGLLDPGRGCGLCDAGGTAADGLRAAAFFIAFCLYSFFCTPKAMISSFS